MTMSKQTLIVAVLCAVSVLAIAAGAAWFSVGAGLIVFGVLLAAWAVVFVLDIAGSKPASK